MDLDPETDLSFTRTLRAPRALVWECWTSPEHIPHFFIPRPHKVTSCEIDLRPGGIFATTMCSPEGEEMPSVGCYLDVVPFRRLVFTDALLPGFRPAPESFFTGALLLEPTEIGTRYTALAIHGTEETRKSHEEMGFHDGWGTVAGQMVDYIKAGFVAA